MKSDLSSRMYRAVIKELLVLVTLLELRKRSSTGYDLILLVQKKFHVLLSPGTVYSCLYALEREKLVEGQCVSRKRVYRLTERGKQEIVEFLNSRAQIATLVLTILNG